MDIFIKILQFVLSLSILVFMHEMGHFLFAKLFKIRVEKFYMFFNPWFSLFKFKKGETEYGMGWLPLGGYVKISGMIDESLDTEQMKQPAKPWEFRARPSWQRLLVMLGGVSVNVILAFFIYIMVLYTWGETYLPAANVKNGVACDEIFQKMGMQNGDVIIGLDGKTVDDFFAVVPDILLDNPKTVQVNRAGETLSLNIPESFVSELLAMSSKSFMMKSLLSPRQLLDSLYVSGFSEYSPAYDAGYRERDKILSVNGHHLRFYDEFAAMLDTLPDARVETVVLRGKDTLQMDFHLNSDGKFGIMFGSTERLMTATRSFTFLEAIPAGINRGVETLGSYLKQLKLLFSHKTEAYRSVGGMMSIGNIFPSVWNWQIFWELTAFISIMLAIVNVLPIPALDGGHVLFLLYEMVTRRKPGEKFMEYAQITGMMILLALFILANVNDVIRFLGN